MVASHGMQAARTTERTGHGSSHRASRGNQPCRHDDLRALSSRTAQIITVPSRFMVAAIGNSHNLQGALIYSVHFPTPPSDCQLQGRGLCGFPPGWLFST